MAEVMKIIDTFLGLEGWEMETIEFSPLSDGSYTAPEEQARMVKKMIDGSIRIIKPYKKHLYSIPLNNVSSANYAIFTIWWQNLEYLDFYPDLINTPTTYYEVIITNTRNPFTRMQSGTELYEGTLQLREV